MGKTRDLSKKIRDTRGIFHAKMGSIKDRNGLDLTEDSKKRWQEYTDELYKKYLHDPDNHNSVITHQEPYILASQVKQALGSIAKNKKSEDDRISAQLFQVLKIMLLKSCTYYASKYGILSSGHRTVKGQGSFQSQRKGMPKNAKLPHNCTHLTR